VEWSETYAQGKTTSRLIISKLNYFEILFFLVAANSNTLLAAVDPQPKRVSILVFGNDFRRPHPSSS
jgi:hypothetical protein